MCVFADAAAMMKCVQFHIYFLWKGIGWIEGNLIDWLAFFFISISECNLITERTFGCDGKKQSLIY